MKANEEVFLASILPFFVFIGILLVLLIIGDKTYSRAIQVIFLLFIAYFVIITNSIVYQVGFILLIFIYFLSRKHKVFFKRPVIFHFILLFALVISIILSLMSFPLDDLDVTANLTIWHVLNQLLFVATTFLLIFIVFEDDIKRLTLENQKLTTEMEKSRVFVNLGENISGLVHNMNGDLGLMTMAASMLGEDVDHKAVEFILKGNKSLQAKIRNILTLAKYSQAEEDMEFSLNALLYSLLEVFNINKKNRIVTTKTDFIDEVFSFGNPSEVSQVFENILKNAYEALVEKKEGLDKLNSEIFEPKLDVMIKGLVTESQISFIDNGPGIKACIDNEKCTGDCSNCNVFKVGRTTKKDGNGLGMISVKRTLEKYSCSMNIRTSHEGTEIQITFPRG